MQFLKNIKHRRQIRASRKRAAEETQMLVKDLLKLTRDKPKNTLRAMHKHRFLIAEINGLIAGYRDWLHSDGKKLSFLISSLFLQESFELLNQREVESLHFVTGPEIEGTKVLDKIVDFRLEKQSVVYAKADTDAIREALIYIGGKGFNLWGYFHIHPGTGPNSIFPSGTDKTLDRLLVKGGYDCIGAIFSRDGFVRFFSSKKFEVNIYGNGVEKVNEKVYRLVEVN